MGLFERIGGTKITHQFLASPVWNSDLAFYDKMAVAESQKIRWKMKEIWNNSWSKKQSHALKEQNGRRTSF